MLTRLRISILASLLLVCSFASAQATEKVLYSFGTNPNDGNQPNGDLVLDAAGNLYGTTQNGGTMCNIECGIVFELSPQPDGSWQETILYNFCSVFMNGYCQDGQNPRAGLVMDAKGNLYGTTYFGGQDYGVVFELSPPSGPGNSWTETVLWTFSAGGEEGPEGRLTFDAAGNLYGTTLSGTSNSYGGAVFELSPGSGGWTEKVLYNFCLNPYRCSDGALPEAGVTFDKAGNLYGTTSSGGSGGGEGWGVLYELSPSAGGWTEAVLHDFSSQNGGHPLSEVSFDNAGNLYATVPEGGPYSPAQCGGVFRLSPTDNGWKAGSFPFNDSGVNGCTPVAGVLVDNQNGSLYGTAESDARYYGGIVYALTDKGQSILHGFCQGNGCEDGSTPNSTLTPRAGKLYGTTLSGGTGTSCNGGCGVVYQIAP